MRKMPTKVANSVESTRGPERPLTWPRMRLRTWDTGVSELGSTGNFSCRQTDTCQINKSIHFPMADFRFVCAFSILPSVQLPLIVFEALSHRGSLREKTPFCIAASTKTADGSFRNDK